MRVINFIKNEGKFEYGDMVRVKELKTDLGIENLSEEQKDNFESIIKERVNIATKKYLFNPINLVTKHR